MDRKEMKYEKPFESTDNYDHDRNLDCLPYLVRSYLFQYLNLYDLMNLQLVSKYFYGIIKSFSIKELSIIDCDYESNKDIYNLKENWFSTSKPNKLENQVDWSKLGLLTNPSVNLFDLKYLRIRSHHIEYLPFRLKLINKFTKLQILELYNIQPTSSDHLELFYLKALSIDVWLNKGIKLVIDTPNLHALNMKSKNFNVGIEFKYPSLKHLQSDDYHEKMLKFINLECLELCTFYNLNPNNLLKFNNLKKIKIFSFPYTKNYHKDKMKKILELKKKDLEIFLFGVEIKNFTYNDKYGLYGVIKFQFKNYDQLEDNLHFMVNVDYNFLLSTANHQLPYNLCKKYTNIKALSISLKIKDEDKLINFIQMSPNLTALYIFKTALVSQKFFDQLPVISQLSVLDTSDMNINFKFINKMTYLRRLSSSKDVLKNDDINLNGLRFLKIIDFKIDNHDIRVYKYTGNIYTVSDNDRNVDLFGVIYLLKNQLFELINNLRNKISKKDKLKK